MARFEVYSKEPGVWKWRLLASGDNEVIAYSSVNFQDKIECLRAIDLVREQAPLAYVKENPTLLK